jgi:hypothetical protein
MMSKNSSSPVEQPVFHKAAENLYLAESSGELICLIEGRSQAIQPTWIA